MNTDTNTSAVAPAPNSAVFAPESGSMSPRGTAEFRNGQWFNAIGLESTEKHRHVSKVWQENCVPFLDFVNGVNDAAEFKTDDTVLLSDVSLSNRLTVELPNSANLRGFGEMGFTEHGLVSLGQRCGVPAGTIEFLREELFHQQLSEVMNSKLAAAYDDHWAKKAMKKNPSDKDKSLLIRTRPDDDGNGQVVRAILSERYGTADNNTLVNMIVESLPQGASDALASHLFTNGDNMNGNILLPDYMKSYPDSDYGVGIAFRNSEIGRDTFQICAFLFRAICINGCIWGRRDSTIKINKKHLGRIDLTALREDVMKMINLALSEGNDLLTQMEYTMDAKIPTEMIAPVIISLGDDNKMSKDKVKAWYRGYAEEPWENGFGVVNGLTRAAQKYSGGVRYELEMTAGGILTANLQASKTNVLDRWAKILDRAKHVEDEVVKEFIAAATVK